MSNVPRTACMASAGHAYPSSIGSVLHVGSCSVPVQLLGIWLGPTEFSTLILLKTSMSLSEAALQGPDQLMSVCRRAGA